MSETRKRPRSGIALFVVALVLLVTLIVVGVVIQRTNQSKAEAGGGVSNSTPSSKPSSSTPTQGGTPSAPPPEPLDNVDGEDLPEVTHPVVSDEAAPSTEQVWAYEQAYFTADPLKREELMKPLATDQYLAEDLSREPVKYEGIEVRVVVGESEIVSLTVNDNRFTAYVVTSVFLETVRGDEVVNRFQGPQHSSAWVNTEEGWRVIKNVGEE